MEKLSIREASERFGLSRARIYQLLDKGAIVGHKSMERGRSAKSWVDGNSLRQHSKTKSGRPPTKVDGMYAPITEACNVSGYSAAHIYRLLEQGTISSKKSSAVLVYLPDLLKYKEKINERKSLTF